MDAFFFIISPFYNECNCFCLQNVFYFCLSLAIIIDITKEVITMPDDKFIVTPKDSKSTTMTIRIYPEINDKLEELAQKSNRSRNELINLALKFAFKHLEFIDDNN